MNTSFSQPVEHKLILSERSRLEITGVEEAVDFDSGLVTLRTVMGMLEIEGEGLKLTSLSTDNGKAVVEGKVQSIYYANQQPQKKGFKRAFSKGG